ncbi:MAG: DsbA family protein [Acidobacteria bacterium]|nr:DsbA family protein [Acidobacteriota bacterium]MCI0621927.1 DsbA family protein [Acidobacteriota bacterium]MCI0719925.1 DsbA family protein [Acidobacteriota bacterium]
MNRLSDKKAHSIARERQSGSASRSLAKPLIVLTVLIVAAAAAALVLVRRSSSENSAGAVSSNTTLGAKPVITPEGWAKGNLAAKTVLVEFGDFQCPSCAAARLKVDNALKKFEKDLKVVFKQYPMPNLHRNAMIAAQAAEAAGRQLKFWEMYEILFARQNEWVNVPDALTFFLKYAAELQLDVEKFRQDMLDGEIRNKIFRDLLEGQVAQVRSVPSFFLNGKMMQGVKNDAEFEELIAQAIRAAQ